MQRSKPGGLVGKLTVEKYLIILNQTKILAHLQLRSSND